MSLLFNRLSRSVTAFLPRSKHLLNCGCWRGLLRVPWTARRSNQLVLKEINLEYSLEGLTQKLKLQYSAHLMWRADSLKRPWCWEKLKAGGEGDDRGWDEWMASPTQWTWVWASPRRWWRTGKLGVLQSMGSQSQTWPSNGATITWAVKELVYVNLLKPFNNLSRWAMTAIL